MKRKRLADLYKRGTACVVRDGEDTVEVWLQKLNPVDHDTVLRRANAARARILMHRDDPESEHYQAAYAAVMGVWDKDPDGIIRYVATKDARRQQESIEAELGAEEEWSKDDYLQGLVDAWHDGLNDRYAIDPDDPEAKRVHEEMKRFSDAVDAAMEDWILEQEKQFENLDEAALLDRASQLWVERKSEEEWYDEYQLASLWKAVRLAENHAVYYFDDRSEVDDLEDEVRAQLLASYNPLLIDVTEGKDTAGTPASSSSAEPSDAAETAAPSGLLVAAL